MSTDNIGLISGFGYGGDYGWGYDNYCLSGNDQYLAYGQILFDSMNLYNQIGLFQEQVYALNYDGSVAFGQTAIWDTTTFQVHGDATKIVDMPFSTTVLDFDGQADVLYAYDAADSSLYVIEQATPNGIPYRWLQQYGLSTNDTVEGQDPDNDGYTNLQEWKLNTDPTEPTPALQLKWTTNAHLAVENTSSARFYELQRTTDLAAGAWQPISQLQGSGSNLLFDVTSDMNTLTNAFYRLRPKIY